MELAAGDVLVLDRGRDAEVAMPRVGEAIALAFGHDRERMHEIRARLLGNPLEDRAVPARPAFGARERVPADMWNLHRHAVRPPRDPDDLARNDAEALVAPELLALRDQHLHAEADAEEGAAARGEGAQ